MKIEEAMEYIHRVNWRGRKPGLSRTRELLAALGNPQDGLKFVHIAGTNGKGSTAAYISSVLRAAGYRTGLYISPYIIRFNERMQVDGEYITDEELCALVDYVQPKAEAMEDKPSEFELITAIAMRYFQLKKCDVVVLEVGLGGELDSTNVIKTPEAAVITAMGLEHTKELGSTLGEIAKAKAGIIKDGGDVVIYGGTPEADAVFESVCEAKKARLYRTDFSQLTDLTFGLDNTHLSFGELKDLTIPLIGTYQPYNAAVVITALRVLQEKGWKISDGDIRCGLAAVSWPGRFEILRRKPLFILDGAHNPHGIRATAESLERLFPGRKITFLMGVMADKDLGKMLPFVAPLAREFIAVRPDYSRSMEAAELARQIEAFGAPAESYASVAEGVREAVRRAGEDGIICALGSLYFSGDVRRAVMELSI